MWSKKSWEVPQIGNKKYKPTVFDNEQAKEIQKKNLNYIGLQQSENYLIAPKAVTNAYSVNSKLVNSKPYHDKFEGVTKCKLANENLYQQSKRLLEHRDGSDRESLIVIDSRKGELIVDNFSNIGNEFKTGLTTE